MKTQQNQSCRALFNAVLLLVPCLAWTASAATLTVTNSADSGPGSLRQAIADAAASDTIAFDASLAGQTITLTNGQLTVDKSLTIDAADLSITIDGNGSHRIFEFASGTTNRLAGLTLTHGRATGPYFPGNSGGAIVLDSGATLTITNSTLANNAAYAGGGIYNQGTLTILNSTLANNVASLSGGGIYNDYYSTLTISNSTLANNAAQYGGAIINFGFGTLTLQNTTLANNAANKTSYDSYPRGGGIDNDGGTVTVQNSTLANNEADYEGGGIYNDGTLSLTNTIVAQNSSSSGPNIGNYVGSNITISHCLTNGVAQLAPLGNYGGPTQTMPPLPGSPAIDAGDDSVTNFLATDQRGFPRVVGSAVDIGAVEIQGVSDTESILGSAWSTDNDGDGNPFGVEFALGTDWQTADATNPANLAIRPTNGFPAVAFGLNPAATNYVQWVVYRSLDLAATNSFVEIYRYDGPTGMAYTNGVPVSVTVQSNLLQVIDESNPRPPAAFYRLGVNLP